MRTILAFSLSVVVSAVAIVIRVPARGAPGGTANGQVRHWRPKKGSTLYKWTRGLHSIDKIVISEGGYFRTPKARQAAHLRSVTLEGREAQDFIAVWRKLDSAVGSLCFSPTYSIRFYSGTDQLRLADVCFDCHNLRLTIGSDVEMESFDSRGPSGLALLSAIKAALESKGREMDSTVTTIRLGSWIQIVMIVRRVMTRPDGRHREGLRTLGALSLMMGGSGPSTTVESWALVPSNAIF
ncbi:MAG TPA: hypothetical protein VEZ90_18935 [Blastocatellia bacterium]|nr:hypothetical protein [Blastocatellia bacterium]